LICPWASRTLLVRKLKGLKNIISISVVEPFLTDQGWRFGSYPGADCDTLNDATYLHEIYTLADPAYTGRATVPVLWDKQRRITVNNESADIVRMLNEAFAGFARISIDLYPPDLRGRDRCAERADLPQTEQWRIPHRLRDYAAGL
jgi:glutathionyl-hydroquinone reductase